jgi:small neutral amino acid transporter SnatA (MarC family)
MEEEMRMNIFFGNLFWGILLILWGGSLILKTFNIHMPLAKIFFAVVIILFGLKLLLGDKITWFNSGRTYKQHGASYIRVITPENIHLYSRAGQLTSRILIPTAKTWR